MCAIYGELGPNQAGHSWHDAAVDSMSHRGPDGRGSWSGDGIFLGMRRLSIIDLAGGQQPIWNGAASSTRQGA